MSIVKIVIEKTKDHYSAYANNVKGIYGAGETPEEAKQSILEAIDLLKKYNKPKDIPAALKGEFKISYTFDAESLLNYYRKIFTKSALEHMTGINQKQLQHYSSGLKKPRETQLKKIEDALHTLGSELLAVQL